MVLFECSDPRSDDRLSDECGTLIVFILIPSSPASVLRQIHPFPYLSAVLVLLLAATPVPDEPEPSWRQGPIRYILAVDEDTAYKKLPTREARAEFIEKFWGSLDPTPETEANERRREFWSRVAKAAELFGEGLVPGWKTDRGKVYILMGPPDRRILRGPSEDWIYEIAPRAGDPLETHLEFRRNTRGEYNMPRDALSYHDLLTEPDAVPVGTTYLAATSDMGSPRMVKGRFRMTEFPTAAVTAEYFVESLEVLHRYDYHRAADGNTHAILTLAIPPSQFRNPDGSSKLPDFALSVTLEDPEDGDIAAKLTAPEQIENGDPEAQRPWLYRSATTVSSGSYRARITIYDRHSHRGSSSVEILNVPDFRRRFTLSTIAVGHEPPLPLAAPADDPPSIISLRAEPGVKFREGDTVYFAYQVYNARHRKKSANLDVRYSFFVRIGGEFRPVGNPITLPHLTGESLTYALPLKGWPPATYKVVVNVTDTLAKKSAEGEESFTIVAAGQ
jgi:GWxTD domain-containing protein